VRIRAAEPHCGQNGGVEGELEPVGDIGLAVEPDAQRRPVVVLRDHLEAARNREQPADERIGRDLVAAVGAHVVSHVVVADERADPEIGPPEDVVAHIDGAIQWKAVAEHAQRGGIGHDAG
jgi:hypothetical protein